MNRQLIEEIFAKVKTDIPEIKKTGLFNDDFEKQNEGTKSGLKFPALFVSFPDGCTYLESTSGVQRTDTFTVRFHIGTKHQTDKDVLTVFDLKEKLYRAFHKWQPSNASSFSRTAEIPDEFRGNYYVFQQDYKTDLVANSKYIENERIPITLTPEITPIIK